MYRLDTMDNTLFVNGRFYTQTQSGVQRFATEITSALRRQCAERVVVLGPTQNSDADFLRGVGRGSGQFWEQIELPRHATGGLLINLGNTAPLRISRQLVVIHDAGVFATPAAYSWKFRLWYKLVHRRLAHSSAKIVTVSEFSRQELVRCLGVHADSVAVISEGADHMDAIVPDPSVLNRFPSGRFVLVVGNLAAHKNLAAVSELAAQLAARDVRLVITGGLASGAFQAAQHHKLPQPACYIGRVSDSALKSLYQHATCLVFPSLYEGFGLPAVEAMACGCPIAAANIPALRETCGDAAQYFDPLSPADIAAQVCRLVDDEALRSGLRHAAQHHVRRFTWDKAANALVGIADQYATAHAVLHQAPNRRATAPPINAG